MDFSITIEVSNPSLTAQDLTVLKTATVKCPLNVGVSGSPATLNVTGATTLQNALTVQGNATLLAALSANGSVALGGPVLLFGPLSKFGVGTYTAPTDGLVIGSIWVPASFTIQKRFAARS